MAKACIVLFGLVLMMACAVFASDEWYCKLERDKFQICRKCKTLDEDCEEAPRRCRCQNMKFTPAGNPDELVGGPEQCEDYDDRYCYVTEESKCSDAEYSSVNEREEFKDHIWSNTEVYYSVEACDARFQDDKIGNEEVLQGIKIVDDRIQEVLDNNALGKEVSFYLDDYEECQEECKSRQGNCGAWSFDTDEEICYIHTVQSCCGQFGKQEQDSNWISGYVCHKCWSTKENTDCPCSVKDRQEIPNTAHGAGGRAPLHATSSGSLTVQSVNVAKNECKCVPKRTRRGRIRCKKPFCALKNDETGCKDKRRCRVKKKRRGRK